MHAAEQAHNARLDGGRVRLVKNNTDYHGRSYGCHENYLTLREVPLDDLVDALVPFLATRQVFAGAGRVGIEGGDAGALQLSQRADFFETVVGINTTARRPIFNTRDEPHADRTRYRRLHVIAGDANRSEWATGMKAATTALVLDAVETGWRAPIRLRDPVAAIQQGLARSLAERRSSAGRRSPGFAAGHPAVVARRVRALSGTRRRDGLGAG